ncbi:copper amine oxidase N-terminal domain-containing protein [Filifactor alocis]|uniref:copper amine oxidase N-terminal domain-containing protein n=1 Tax=Filifactor alocis TaxID=143361 RepID=UPI0028D12882|nr:copper amine oxidase N-terminal domain-containing protein [Filifactor alocis]
MKKKLSLVVAGLMALTLAPVNSAFAAEENFSSVQIVENNEGTATFRATFKLKDADVKKTGTIGIRLLGDDVEFANPNPVDPTITPLKVTVTPTVPPAATPGVIAGPAAGDFDGKTQAYASVTTAVATGEEIVIEGTAKFDNAADGEYKIEYDLEDIGLGKTERVFAKVKDNDGDFTKVTESPKKVGRGKNQKLASFEIKGNVGEDVVIELPSDDFEWAWTSAPDNLTTDLVNANPKALGGAAPKTIGIDGRKLTITLTSTKASVTPVINVKKDAPKGDIELDVKKGDKTDTIKVGEYVDHEIKMELVKSLKEELANGDTYKVEVKVKTTDKDTLPKYIDFESEGADVKVTGKDYIGDAKDDFDDNFTWNNPDVTKTKEVKVKLEVKPDWDAKGDVVLTAKPRGYEELKVTILKVTPVAQMKVEEKEVLGGDAKVAVNDIVITETKAGAFKSGTRFGVSLTGLKFEDAKFDTKGTIEAEGINIKDYKLDKDDKTLYFTINGRSKKDTPAKITLKDVQVVSNRALPFGTHKLTFVNVDTEETKKDDIKKGTNYMYESKKAYELSDINAENFIKVVDKVSKVKKTTIFTLGSADYTVEGVAMKLDAPVFTQDNYTMLPVRAIADALGVEVVWNQENLTATFIDGDIVVSVTQNAKILYKNGNQYPMATKATVTADRMFIPVSSVGDAFGLTRDYDYTYSQATKQVTIYPKKETMKAEEKKAEEVKPEEKKAEETK